METCQMALTEILIFRKIKGNTMNITEFTIMMLAVSRQCLYAVR